MDEADFFYLSNLLMVALSPQGMIWQVNPAFEKMLGRSAAELVGQPFSTILDPFSHEKASRMLAMALQTGPDLEWELDVLPKAGMPKLVGFSAFVVRRAQQDPQEGFACIGRDLTEKMDFTARLAKMNQELEGALLRLEKAYADLKAAQAQVVQSEKLRALGQMVAGVAHEINNPAAYISSNLAYLAEIMPKLQQSFEAYRRLAVLAAPAEQARLRALEEQAGLEHIWQDLPSILQDNQLGMERISSIVLSLRNFARMDVGERHRVDLNDGLQATLNIVRPLFREQVKIVAALGELPKIDCYAGELNQVFLNLLLNACQAMTKKGTVWVSTQAVAEGVRVTIRDTGCGMDAATLARLGEPFFTTKEVGQGTGLGLAVSVAIVQKHGGQIHFESQLGRGTQVVVDIPFLSANSSAA